MIQRKLQETIENKLFKGKAIIVIGARQVGKSTLFQHLIANRTESALSLNCDEPEVRELLSNSN